jgi:hypothetical protein
LERSELGTEDADQSELGHKQSVFGLAFHFGLPLGPRLALREPAGLGGGRGDPSLRPCDLQQQQDRRPAAGALRLAGERA